MSVDKIYQQFQVPEQIKVLRVDGAPLGPEAPSYSVIPAPVIICSDGVKDPRVYISDFGEAWLNQDMPSKVELNTPAAYLPPEATLAKGSISSPADIWTLACSTYQILGIRPLFEIYFSTERHGYRRDG